MTSKNDEDEDEAGPQANASQAPLVVSVYEDEVAKLQEQIVDLSARLSASEAETRAYAIKLAAADQALRRKRGLLTWIVNSRSWKLTSVLRQLKFLRQRVRLRDSASIIGELELPVELSVVPGQLEISGWTYSSSSEIVAIEAFIDGMELGRLDYGQSRPDVSAYPVEVPVNCGYRGKLLLDESLNGKQKLVVRITDRRGRSKDYSRTVVIDQPQTGYSLSSLQPDDSVLDSLLRDDLSIAKRIQTSNSRTSLQSFLVANSVLRFSEFSQPDISIILVLHNRAELTLQCLNSILQSDARPYEVIIVDNASTDETHQLLKQVAGVRLLANEKNLHYLLACNQAGEVARGKYLLFLNNDAQLLPHSISAALVTIESADDIGAVGGKIILPDGNLQEAGSIVWADGSCLGYGRGDSPMNPAYMFRRDVDYCSAVFLLTRRDLFVAEGGFDRAYVPAYYEETDYCLKLWASGKRIVYDPDVTVWHYEFASSSSSAAAIELQAEHRNVLAERHSNWLSKQLAPAAANVLAARARRRDGAKRILIFDDRVPHAGLGSGFPRSNRIIRELVKLGHLVTCYPLTYWREDWPAVYEDIPREVEVMIGLGLTQLEQFLIDRPEYYDIVWISRPHNLASLNPLLRNRRDFFGRARIFYDAEALFSLRHVEQKRLQGKKVSPQERQQMLDQEISLTKNCDRVISVSQQERQEFLNYGLSDVHTLGHALEISPTPNDFAARKNILFVGAIHEPGSPNADSVLWFCARILPKIRKALGPQLNMIIAGVMHPEVEEQLDKKDIQVMGVIKDLTELYDQCRIFVAPTRFSAGVPLKVIEAAAHGLPIVATSLAGSQLVWKHDRELLLAEDEESFAAACVQLYQDRDLWQRLRDNALRRVASDCSTDSFSEQLRTILR